jgi:hypothetical protein
MRTLILLLFLKFSSTSFSQLSEHKGYIGLRSSYGIVDKTNYYSIGATGEYLFKSRIGLVYNLDFIKRKDDIWNIHSSVGSLGGPIVFAAGVVVSTKASLLGFNNTGLGKAGLVAGIAIFLLPDGVTYHFPIQYNWDIAPYANVLGLDYVRNTADHSGKLKWSTSFGVKTTYWTMSNFSLNCFIETRKVASYGWNFGAGFGIGYSFKRFEDHFESEPTETPRNEDGTWHTN